MSRIVDDIIAGKDIDSCINGDICLHEDAVYDLANKSTSVVGWVLMALAATQVATSVAKKNKAFRDYVISREIKRDRHQLEKLRPKIPDEVYKRLNSILNKKEKHKTTTIGLARMRPELTWLVNNMKMQPHEREALQQALADAHKKSVPLTWSQSQLMRRLAPQTKPKTYTGEL